MKLIHIHTRGIELQLQKLREMRADPRRALDILRGIPAPPSDVRDMTAAVGEEGGPASWRPEVAGAPVALHQPDWRDAEWSSLYHRGTEYATAEPPDPRLVAEANLRARRGAMPDTVQGPMLHQAVWTWEVPVYFWFGGMASASSFIAVACDLAGDGRSARISRRVALGTALPCAPLLVLDLGRPERFLHMLRIFKVRSPMSMGSWCLSAFSALGAGAVGADLLGWRRTARAAGAAAAASGLYLGSYTAVLLASTAIPVWNRSRALLGPIFISTAALSGAAACKLTLTAAGARPGHPMRIALAQVEIGAMAAELILSAMNRRRLGWLAEDLEADDGGRWFKRAERLGQAGIGLRVVSRALPAVRRRGAVGSPPLIAKGLARTAEHAASICFMSAALCYRMAWVAAGRTSANDVEAIARDARERVANHATPETSPSVKLDIIQHR